MVVDGGNERSRGRVRVLDQESGRGHLPSQATMGILEKGVKSEW